MPAVRSSRTGPRLRGSENSRMFGVRRDGMMPPCPARDGIVPPVNSLHAMKKCTRYFTPCTTNRPETEVVGPPLTQAGPLFRRQV